MQKDKVLKEYELELKEYNQEGFFKEGSGVLDLEKKSLNIRKDNNYKAESQNLSKKQFMAGAVLLTFLLLLSASYVRADSIGNFQQNTAVELYQTCNNCTYCNVTNIKIKSPVKTDLLTDTIAMNNRGTYYYYDINSWNTTTLGEYEYCYQCANYDDRQVGCLQFSITPSGTELSTSQSIIYFIFLLASVGIFVICFYYAVALPWRNQRDDDGYVIGVNEFKYMKLFLICMSYMLLLLISGLLRGITANFISEIGVDKFFNLVYTILLTLVYPIMVCSLVFALIIFISNKKFMKAIAKGIPVK